MKAALASALLAFACGLSRPHAQDAPAGPAVDSTSVPAAIAAPPMADEEPPIPFRKHRVLFHPVTSFFINGLNGRYELRFADRRLGLGVPFYLGRHTIRGIGSETTWGTGLALSLFRTRRIQTARFTASAEWMDVRRVDFDPFFHDSDPTFPDAGSEADIYHFYVYALSALVGYRWEYPSVPFTVDLDFGGAFSRSVGPRGHFDITDMAWVYPAVYPVVHFSFGVPF